MAFPHLAQRFDALCLRFTSAKRSGRRSFGGARPAIRPLLDYVVSNDESLNVSDPIFTGSFDTCRAVRGRQ
jgi:hypothetical protein